MYLPVLDRVGPLFKRHLERHNTVKTIGSVKSPLTKPPSIWQMNATYKESNWVPEHVQEKQFSIRHIPGPRKSIVELQRIQHIMLRATANRQIHSAKTIRNMHKHKPRFANMAKHDANKSH